VSKMTKPFRNLSEDQRRYFRELLTELEQTIDTAIRAVTESANGKGQ
jgi:hypothetical protein